MSAILEDGHSWPGDRVVPEYEAVLAFVRTLQPDDEVVLDTGGTTAAVVRLIAPHVRKVSIANPL